MHRWRRSRSNDAGSASIEFIGAVAILLIPLLYLTIALADVQNQNLGAQSIGRHTARLLATGGSLHQAETVARSLADEYGIDADTLSLEVSCTGAGACPRAGAVLTVRVSALATLPMMAGSLFGTRAAVPVTASAVQKVSDHGSAAS